MLRKLLSKSTVRTFHLSQGFLIVVTQPMQNIQGCLDKIFENVHVLGLLDVNVLIKDEVTQIWSLHFYRPYVRNCHSFETIKIKTFTAKNYTNNIDVLRFDDLFPRKEFQFQNCPLIISTFSLEPFVIIRNTTNGSIEYDGIDVRIVNEISKTLHLKPIYMQAPDGKGRGLIYKNGTSTGAIKMVRKQNKIE